MVCQRRSYWWLGVLTKHHSKSGVCNVPVHIKGVSPLLGLLMHNESWLKLLKNQLKAKISRGEGEEILKLLKAVWVGKMTWRSKDHQNSLIQLSLAALSLRIGADTGIHLETIQTPQLPHGYILEETTGAWNLQVYDFQLQISRWMMKMEAKRWIPWTRCLTSMPCEKPCYLAKFHGRFFWREWRTTACWGSL